MSRLLVCLLALLALAGPAGAGVRLTVLHTNDIHGWVMARPDRAEPGRRIGGAAALARAVQRLRDPEGRTLLLDAGDWFQGTPEGTLSKGRVMAEVFNALGYDAVAVGNHEYDLGEEALKDIVRDLRPPALAANIRSAATGSPPAYVRPWIVRDLKGVRVGVFGLVTSAMRQTQFERNVAGLEFVGEIEAAREAVAELKRQGARIIIALSHVGHEVPGSPKPSVSEEDIAREAPGIDLIVGGHTHAPVEPPRRLPGTSTWLVNSGHYLTHVGQVVLELDPEGRKVASVAGARHPLYVDELGEDEAVLRIVRNYEERVGKALDAAVGTAADPLPRGLKGETPLGGWLTDCVRRWSKTEIAFQNAGGIRADLPAGEVRLRHLFQIMPFDNYLVTLYMTGGQVLEILDHGVGGAPGVVQVSGVRFEHVPGAPAGRRVRRAWVRGERLEKDRVYSVSAPDFLVQGGDGYAAFQEGTDPAVTPVLIRDAMAWCAREHSPIEAPAPGRIKALR